MSYPQPGGGLMCYNYVYMRFVKDGLVLAWVLVGVVAFTAPASARVVPNQQTATYTYVAPTTSDTSATTTIATTTPSAAETTTQSTATATVVSPVSPPAIVAQPPAVVNTLATQLDSMLKQLIVLLVAQLQDLQQQVAARLGQQPAVTTPPAAIAPSPAAATTTAQTAATSTTTTSAVATSTTAANQLPKVNISFPYSGLELTAPASLDVIASAVDDDGTVSGVEFFGDGGSLGTYTGPRGPWSVRWGGISAGTHTLTARVTDDKGGQTTSAPVTLIVKASSQATTGFTDSPPTITIETTITGTALTATATVATYAGTITNVVWSRAATSTSDAAYVTDATSPYNGAAALAVGTHTISAIVTNSQGSTARSASTTVTTN